jgi:hypothetical protein
LVQSHYFLVVGTLQFIGGFVPLGLLVLCPILVNIALFHVFLNPPGSQMAIVVSVLAAFLLWAHRDRFAANVGRQGDKG